MFTVEHEYAETVVTILSDHPDLEDVQVIFEEDTVWIRQVDEDTDKSRYQVIALTNPMWLELIAAYTSPQGCFTLGK